MTAARITRDLEFKGECLSVSSFFRPGGDDLVVFIHGLGCTKDSFLGAWDAGALNGYSLLAPDLPGFGASRAPASFSSTIEDFAAVLPLLLGDVANRRVHLVCHSMGGAVGLLMAQGIEVASFTNVEGNLIGEDCGLLSRRTAGLTLDAFRRAGFKAMMEAAASSGDFGLEKWAVWFAECDPAAFHAAATSLVAWSDSGRLREIFISLGVPKVYIHGEWSANPPVLEVLETVPRVRIAGCGHMAMVEKAEVFFAAVGSFLEAVAATG